MKKILFGLAALISVVNPGYAFNENDCPSVQEINSHAHLFDSVFHDGDPVTSFMPVEDFAKEYVYSSRSISHGNKHFHLLMWVKSQEKPNIENAIQAAEKVDFLEVAIDTVVPGKYKLFHCRYINIDDPKNNWIWATHRYK